MRRAEIREGVARVFAESLSIVDVDESTGLFRDLELDSIKQLTLVVEIENYFKVCFDEGDEAGIETVGDVVDTVERKLSER